MATATVSTVSGTHFQHLTIKPPTKATVRTASNVFCVFDKSGSMGSPANPSGPPEIRQFTKMDLAKRAAEIMARSLDESSTFAVLAYDDLVYTIFPKAKMTPGNKDAAAQAINLITDGGGTALWDGLKAGLDMAKTCDPTALNVVILLTDGEPSKSPSEGEVNAVKAFGGRANIVTIGIGYDMNSQLLMKMAEAGGVESTFNFISDGSTIITNFVNLMANLQTGYAHDTVVRIPGQAGVLGFESTYDAAADVTVVPLGHLRFGQSRDLVFSGSVDGVTVVYRRYGSMAPTKLIATSIGDENDCSALEHIQAVQTIRNGIRIANVDLSKALAAVKDLVVGMTSNAPIANDLLGEVALAFGSKDAWNRWGQHYTRALVAAHLQQQCTNFKDPGLAAYGGDDFRTLKVAIDEMCNGLPVPKATHNMYARTVMPQVSAATFTQSFNSADNGCFGPNGMMTMGDGTLKRVIHVKAGDTVYSAGGPVEVLCVVAYAGGRTIKLCGGPRITKWHPVYLDGRWRFPADLEHVDEHEETMVYNFVLKSGHVVIVDNMACVTLGHGLTAPVVGHEFFSGRVVNDLLRFPGWSKGIVFIDHRNVVRGPDGLVSGYRVLTDV